MAVSNVREMTKKMNAGKHWLGHGKIVGHFSDGLAEWQGGKRADCRGLGKAQEVKAGDSAQDFLKKLD